MLDWLKGILGDVYTEEIDKAVSERVGKDFVPRADFNTANEAKKALEGQLSAANDQIQSFKDMDIDGIKKAADDWKNKAEKAEADAKKQLEQMQFDYALTDALNSAKVRNDKAVKALLDMDALKFNDGKIIGLDDQLEKLKSENGYLFENEAQKPQFSAQIHTQETSDLDTVRAVMGLPPKK